MTPVTLASTSQVRRNLLTAAGVTFKAASPGVDEDALKAAHPGLSPRDLAGLLADRKALALSRPGVTEGLVIGADQTLEYNGRLFDKAQDMAQARARLLLLRGQTHNLHAAVSVARDGGVIWRETVTSSLTMRDFPDAWLENYLLANQRAALSSVGCYELEGEGLQLFSRIDGDFFAILGLPMMGLLACLRREGALAS